MTAGNHVPLLCMLILVLCSFIGTVAATEYFGNGGYLSTETMVSSTGTVNETVSLTYTTIDDGMAKTTEWVSSQTLNEPSALAWSSLVSIGMKDDSLSWDFQMQGLPLTWKKTQTVLPVTVKEVRTPPGLSGTWAELQTSPFFRWH